MQATFISHKRRDVSRRNVHVKLSPETETLCTDYINRKQQQ